MVFECLLWLAAGLGLYLDAVSAKLYWRRIRDGVGPSGVPVVALLFYELRALVHPLDCFDHVYRPTWLIALWVGTALLLHVTLQYGVPFYAWHSRKH
jgi:hypothetical protein